VSVASEYGPLQSSGVIDGFTYEVRNSIDPIVFVYKEIRGTVYERWKQKGGMTTEAAARTLIAEMPKAAFEV